MSAPRCRLPGHSPLPDHPTRHQRFMRSLPCLRCSKPAPSECANVGMVPGLTILPSDRYFVPLCGPETIWDDCCHSRKHYRGAARFWAELGLDPIDVALQLWRVSGDGTAGQRVMARARQAVAFHYRDLEGEGSSSPSAPGDLSPFKQRRWPTAMAPRHISSEFAALSEHRS